MVKCVKYTIYTKPREIICLLISDELTGVDVHTLVMVETTDKIHFMTEPLRMMPIDPEKPWATSPD